MKTKESLEQVIDGIIQEIDGHLALIKLASKMDTDRTIDVIILLTMLMRKISGALINLLNIRYYPSGH